MPVSCPGFTRPPKRLLGREAAVVNGTETQTSPLSLFWWRSVPNFGDALSRFVVEYVSGREIQHSGVGGADLLAVGSVLQIARRKFAERARPQGRTVVWGSGLLHPTPRDFCAMWISCYCAALLPRLCWGFPELPLVIRVF